VFAFVASAAGFVLQELSSAEVVSASAEMR
jgi:hypothetical protein